MSSVTSSDSICVELPPSLTKDQIQPLPLAGNISQGNLLTSLKIASAYNIPPSNGANVKIGVISLGGGFSQTDLNKSMTDLGLTIGNITFVGVDGAVNNYTANASVDGENMLDLVCVAGMAPSANIILYKGLNDSITYSSNVAFANAVNSDSSFGNTIQRAVDDDCDIITISWGLSEAYSAAYPNYFCGDFLAAPLANAAAKGISVFVAAGDYGSAASYDSDVMAPDYPSVNANVVAVGGTYLTLKTGDVRLNETVYNNSESIPGFGGSGGVSSMISRPVWQNSLSYKTYPGNIVSSLTSRGIPDISAAMNAYGVWLGNTVYGFSGTSASSPIMAGIVARFISLSGQHAIGNSLHSKIYSASSSTYLDITAGNNASLLPTGYASTVGWDATTGMGVPNGRLLYDAIYGASTQVKTDIGWVQVQNIQVKTDANTWEPVKNVYIKTDSTTWKQVY